VGLNDIRKVFADLKLDAKWTLTAEAREYRETMALEQKLRDNPEFRRRWIEEQAMYDSILPFDEDGLMDDQSVIKPTIVSYRA
jgi:hypothetical protein